MTVQRRHLRLSQLCQSKECKRKWSTLRIQQRRILLQNLTRKRKSVHWQFYEPLQFLIPHMEVSLNNTDSTRSNFSDDSEVDDSEPSSYMENENKNFTMCQMNSSNAEATDHQFHGNNQVILSYPHDQQQQEYITSDQSDHSKSIVVSKADTISHSHENQCHYHKDNNFISLNYFLMDVQLQMSKLNELAQMELKIDIQKMILDKLRKPENLKND